MSLPCGDADPGVHADPSRSIDVEVAGRRCRVESSSSELLCLLASRRSWRPSSPVGEPALRISYAVRDQRRPAPPVDAAGPFEVDRSGPVPRIADDTFSAEIDLGGGRVRAEGLLSLAGIDTMLRVVLPELVDDALLLHSCVLGRNGKAWVCAGPSGAGKSTLLSLLPDLAVGDELALLARRADTVRVRPFWATTAAGGPLEVDRIFLLEHGTEHRRRPVGVSEALRRLARETGWPVLSRESAERSFSVLAWLVHNVPVLNLQFTPDADVLDALSG